MSDPDDGPTTLTDDDVQTHRLDTSPVASADDAADTADTTDDAADDTTDDTADDTDDTSDATDTGDDDAAAG
jgi:hypothetical protein